LDASSQTTSNPSCPRCGSLLEMATFVETWDSDGKAKEIETNFVCRRCGVRWVDMDLAAEEEVQEPKLN
jgi:C4-type Zn-finger protein